MEYDLNYDESAYKYINVCFKKMKMIGFKWLIGYI